MKQNKKIKYKTFGKSRSLRLKGFDYSTPGAYFLTICSSEGQEVFCDPNLASEVIKSLKEHSKRYCYKIYTYCLMPNHLHILVGLGEHARPVSQFMQCFKSLTTRMFWKLGGKGKLWQRGFYDHIVRKEESLIEIAKYILANPVRKGLTETTEEYPFSGSPYQMEEMQTDIVASELVSDEKTRMVGAK
jgi:putative transposase